MPKDKEKNIKWNLSPLLPDDDSDLIEEERENIKKAVIAFSKKWKDREDYLSDPKTLKEALDDYEDLMRTHGTSGNQGYYFMLRRAQNLSDSNIKAKQKKVEDFSNEMEDKIRFFEIKLSKIDKQKQKEFLESEDLQVYKSYLRKRFRESEYILSEPEERIISLKSGPAYFNWVSMRSDFLSREEREVLTGDDGEDKKSFADILSLTHSKNKKVRDSAAKAFNDILKDNVDVAEAEFNSVLENKKADDKLRGFDRPDMSRIIADDMEEEVVDTIIKVVSDNFHISSEYYKLKSQLLGVEKLDYHERNVPFGSVEKNYSFDNACSLIKETLKDLDVEFLEIFEKFLNNGHIDVFPRKGKRDGAFCAYNLLSQPVYILLNFANKLRDVTIFAHELGHGINDEMMRKEQNSLNFGTPTSTAEVASTFFEDFVLERILEEADDELKLSILIQKLNDEIGTIFRQIAAVNFERQAHKEFREKGYLSKDDIGKIFKKHMESYMGEYVEQSKGSENWWVYWSHLRNFFYNYTYAGGLLISKSLQREVREDKEFIDNFKNFLGTGLSKSPKEMFLNMGIDITDKSFWNKGIKEIGELLQETKDLAKKLGKI